MQQSLDQPSRREARRGTCAAASRYQAAGSRERGRPRCRPCAASPICRASRLQAAVQADRYRADHDHRMRQPAVECRPDRRSRHRAARANSRISGEAGIGGRVGSGSSRRQCGFEATRATKESERQMSRIGVMVCGHGSRDLEAITEFQSVAAGIAQRLPQYPVASRFPRIRPADHPRRARQAAPAVACEHILAVPGMLFAAGHVKNDIPSVLNTYAAQHPRPADRLWPRSCRRSQGCSRVAAERIEAAEARVAQAGSPREETLLMVVGRGTSDPDANSNIAKVARMLWEGMGFGWAEVCYSGVTFPLVGPALEHAVKLGYRRIIVFPVFPVHRRAGQAHLSHRRPAGRAPSRRSSSSRRRISTIIRWCWTPSPTGSRKS